jgi:hypothetical protein
MDSLRFDRLTRSYSSLRTRRGALRALVGAGTLAAAPVLLTRHDAAAFRSLSGCKNHCDRFEGNCHSRCNSCCERVVNGNQNRCNFGCGAIRTKKKRKKKK